MKNKNNSDFDNYTNILYEIREYSEKQYDKLIVYLSSGALVLTVGFVKELVDLSKINDLFLLFFSWGSFVTSLIIILISQKTSLYSIDFQLKGKENISNCLNTTTEVLNWLSMIALITGTITFVRFIIMAFSIKGG